MSEEKPNEQLRDPDTTVTEATQSEVDAAIKAIEDADQIIIGSYSVE